jgi:hypothetical protein
LRLLASYLSKRRAAALLGLRASRQERSYCNAHSFDVENALRIANDFMAAGSIFGQHSYDCPAKLGQQRHLDGRRRNAEPFTRLCAQLPKAAVKYLRSSKSTEQVMAITACPADSDTANGMREAGA